MKFGSAFSDNVIIDRGNKRMFRPGVHAWWSGSGRALLFSTALFLTFFVLVWRLFDLTIIQGHRYRVLAEGNRTKELIRHASRGILYDRTGKALTENIPEYRLIRPCEGADGKKGTACTSRLTREEGDVKEKAGLPSGSFLEVDYQRRYLYPEAVAHVSGYIGELTSDEIKDEYYLSHNYGYGDIIGRTGAEAIFEDRLRGRNGKELVEVSSDGRILRTLGRDPEVSGESITLSIDAALSQVAAEAFPPGKKGAVIVSKPQTGEILVLYSSPSFNPNQFTLGMTNDQYQALVTNVDRPMFNRAIGGVYPPASTFKIVTSLAGLMEKAITKDTRVEDTGVIKIGPYEFPNWFFKQYGKTDGMVDVTKALARSNDIFYYKTGEALGVTKLGEWTKKFGVGKPLGVELPGEASGLVPDPEWKKSRFSTPQDILNRNNEWYLGDTYHISIGQGYMLTTPIQVNAWTNVVANGGRQCRPTILKNDSSNGNTCRDFGIPKDTVNLVMTGMRDACDTGGTGWPFFGFGIKKPIPGAGTEASPSAATTRIRIPVACKTGTAEFGDEDTDPHAWFTAFAPIPKAVAGAVSDDSITGEPELSVSVLVENEGEGSDIAAPVAKKIFEAWFSR